MLITNTGKNILGVGEIILLSGVNSVEDSLWNDVSSSREYKRACKGMIESGAIVVVDKNKKLTVAMVKDTYDLKLLKEWEKNTEYKGPLKGAIKSQIEQLDLFKEE